MHRSGDIGVRAGLWIGVAAAVVLLAAFAIPAPPPSPDAPASELTAFLEERRTRLLWSSVLIAAGGVLYVCFLCAVAASVAAAKMGPSAADVASVAAGTTGAAILVAGAALQSALVLQSAGASDELVRFGFDAYNSLVTIAGAFFGGAVVALALGARLTGVLPAAIVHAGWLVAPLQLLTLIGLATTEGFFAAGGTMALVAFWALVAWYVAVAAAVMRRTPAPVAG